MKDDKIIEVLARVEDERKRFERREPDALGFNMDVWHSGESESEGSNVCGTTACFAGHAAVANGYWLLTSTDCAKPKGEESWKDRISIEEAGRRALGLTTEQADDLFYVGSLDGVYETLAGWMGVDETVLRDKVQASRKMVD